jgi:hypothetical protein
VAGGDLGLDGEVELAEVPSLPPVPEEHAHAHASDRTDGADDGRLPDR